MTNAEWTAVRPLLPVPAWLNGRSGRPDSYCHRQLLDAIRYLVAGGISWRAMPADFPAWGRVYAFFRRWREHGLINEFHDRLRGKAGESEGREAEPTAGIIDAQSVRAAATVPADSRGYDGGKKVPGRKRHIVTDTLGLLLVVAVTAANIGDRDAAAGLLMRLRRLHRDITLVWADGGYTGSLVDRCRDKLGTLGLSPPQWARSRSSTRGLSGRSCKCLVPGSLSWTQRAACAGTAPDVRSASHRHVITRLTSIVLEV
ncbi:IS5 family transposase [Streptomyces sp. NPDC018352]|uniref:IS5 family transposase n=1 Tax=Streptomyces sp. NPDC018352 TaxID=3157194 RepID=UPI003405639B